MSLSKEKIIQTIFAAIDEVNNILVEEERLEKLPNTILVGDNGKLDSLGLINFIVEVEGRVQKRFGMTLDLIEALDSPDKPMSSISCLADFIEIRVNGDSK